jgi:predicted dehydrogenase
MKTGFGIIGCGNIARFYFHGLEAAGARVVAIADINAKAAEPYAAKYGARFMTDWRELLADPEVTVVCVLTGSRLHREICLAALAAGKDVICEKTMTNDADEAAEVAAAALASGQLFFAAFMKRFFPAAKKAKELMPRLGRIFSAQVRAFQNWGDFYNLDSDKGFEYIVRSYGGAVVKCAGSHMIDMTLDLLGRPESLYAHVDYVPGSNLDRKASALFEYANGMVAHFETAVHPLKKIGYERNSWDESIRIYGVGGSLELYTTMWDHTGNCAALLVHYDDAAGTSTEYRFDVVDPFDAEIAHFCTCLEERRQEGPGVVDGFAVDTVISAIMSSAAGRMPVRLDWRGF